MMVRILRTLGSGISITLMVAVGFSLFVWFLGPIIGFGEGHLWDSVLARLISIGLIFFIALGTILLLVVRRSKQVRAMEEDIVESVEEDSDEDDELVRAELAELKGKLKDVLRTLRKSKLGRRSLYELPWYVIIGPPGAGKTTAIVNSGLQFPLADKTGRAAVSGVGGTRNCDWWFTNNAVLIDTAGRYTTQESGEADDNAGWLGFLKLLKKHRKRQPINGAIVAISLSDLSLQDEVTQKSHAVAIRKRLHELREKLGVRFPVYIIFTKSDLIAGFAEFFEDLSKDDREQVWGFTLPLLKSSKAESSQISTFDEEFGLLLGRINSQSLDRMQKETDHQRRSLIAAFPSQVASIRTTACSFVEEIFQDSRFEKRHLLRGVYFTSGTQEGTPIDRLMMGMARTFGIGRQAIGAGRGSGRSFFLTRLFEDVLFPEAGLVSADDKVERNFRWSRRIAIAAAVIVGFATTGLWVRSYQGNTDLIVQAAGAIRDYRLAADRIPVSPVADSDVAGIVPALNILRDIPGNPKATDEGPERALTWGLYQGRIIGNQASRAYRASLNQHLLPRILLRLEDQMQENINKPNFLYESLKIYLMLGKQGPMNRDLVTEWLTLDWSLSFAADQQLLQDLNGHLTALLSEPIDDISLNGPLVEHVQELLAELPLARRVYNGIISSPLAQSQPKWSLVTASGTESDVAITRSSGKSLREGIDGIFTNAGFHCVFLAEAIEMPSRIESEAWVLGEVGAAQSNDIPGLTRELLDIYSSEFIDQYEELLRDIDVVQMKSQAQAEDVTRILASPNSPIRKILEAVAMETELTVDKCPKDELVDTTRAAGAAGEAVGLELTSALSSRQQQLIAIMRQSVASDATAPPPPPGSAVEARFDWLQKLVEENEGRPSKLSELMAQLAAAYAEFNKRDFAGGDSASGQVSDMTRFLQSASALDGPIPRWASQIVQGTSGITVTDTRSSLSERWKSEVLPFCERAIANRYPFDRSAGADVAIQDFTRVFAPGGLVDSFFDRNLAGLVDKTGRTWTWKRVNGADLGISPVVLQQLQYAGEIRDAFFAAGDQPAIRFQITPEALDPKARGVALEIDGQLVEFRHRTSPKPVAINWPGAIGSASIALSPGVRNSANDISRTGPWAWFRLLSAAELRKTAAEDRMRVIFKVGGRIAIFELQTGSFLNPFSLPALSQFSCPKSF